MLIPEIKYKTTVYPCGEIGITLLDPPFPSTTEFIFQFDNIAEIFELLLYCDALRREGVTFSITIPYVPFGRQDRVTVKGEAFSLAVFADIINSLGAKKITVYDPHSDVTPALIKNCEIISQADLLAPHIRGKENFFLISPDGGALKKIYNFAKQFNSLGVIECSKQRDVKTGDISGVVVNMNAVGSFKGMDCYIVDDICDGGRTFVEIAKVLKFYNPGKIVLMVTHGFFTKGLSVFDGLIDEIYTWKGRVK